MKKEKPILNTAGGQAVIEGVMMMSNQKVNVSVRKGKNIISQKRNIKKRNKILRFYFIRGIMNLVDMLKIGMWALIWSADQQAEKSEKISKKEIAFSLGFAFLFAILLFVALPLYLTRLLYGKEGIFFNLVDGILRVSIFLMYIYAISFMKDVQRVFQYHGAEHMTISCYESGKKISVENVKKFTTLHPRCGSSFLMIVLIISILVFSLITTDNFYAKLALRVVLIPVIAGISYEILKVAAKFQRYTFFRFLNKPGLWLQHITTQKPDKEQIEVAIHSLKKVI